LFEDLHFLTVLGFPEKFGLPILVHICEIARKIHFFVSMAILDNCPLHFSVARDVTEKWILKMSLNRNMSMPFFQNVDPW